MVTEQSKTIKCHVNNSYPPSSEEGVSNLCWGGLGKLFGIGKEVWAKPFQGCLMAAQVGGVAWAKTWSRGCTRRVQE